jgi:hypothetical protein
MCYRNTYSLKLDARIGIEPMNSRFADDRLTAWLTRDLFLYISRDSTLTLMRTVAATPRTVTVVSTRAIESLRTPVRLSEFFAVLNRFIQTHKMAVHTGFEPVVSFVTGRRGQPDSPSRPYRGRDN